MTLLHLYHHMNTPIESSKFGVWVHRKWLRLCIRYLRATIIVHSNTENRVYLASLKSELMEFKGQLGRLEIQQFNVKEI